MDKEEAERLARAIRKAPVAWIQVQAIECQPVTHTHELKCAYRQERKGLFHPQETWTTLWITSPRQWIDLLTKHRDDLELPQASVLTRTRPVTHDLRRHLRSCSLDGWDRLESTEQWRKIGEEDPDDEAPDRLWSRFHHEQCGRCKKPIDYGALAEVYTPRPEPGNYTTKEEEFQAADDYCNALADRQEQGQFTLYAMYPVCDECASTMILEDVSDFAAPLPSTVRAEPREHLWIAVCIQYEPGAYGKYQPFLIHSYIPTPIEQIYARARQSYLSDEPRFEAYPYPIDETHHHAQRTRRRPTANVSLSHRKKRHKPPRREK